MKTFNIFEQLDIIRAYISSISRVKRAAIFSVLVFGVVFSWETFSVFNNYKIQKEFALDSHAKWYKPLFNDPDKAQWAMLIEQAQNDKVWRVKWIPNDNYPVGRPVHWSSSLLWLGIICSKIYAGVTGAPVGIASAWGAFWIVPIVFSIGAAGLFFLTAIVISPTAGFIVAGLLVFSPWATQYISSNAIKHRGLVLLCSEIFVMATYGALKIHGRKNGALLIVISAMACGVAVWVSPMSFLPLAFALGVGVLVSFILDGYLNYKNSSDLTAAGIPDYYWKIWVGVFSTFTIGIYIIEYFPSGWTFRLEINNPLITLSVVGAVMCLEWARKKLIATKVSDKLLIFGAALAVIVPVTAHFGGEAYYSPAEPEFARFLKVIEECAPTAPSTSGMFWLDLITTIFAFVFLLPRVRTKPALILPMGMVILLLPLTFIYNRWIMFELGMAAILIAACFDPELSCSKLEIPFRRAALILMIFWCTWGAVWTYATDTDIAVNNFGINEKRADPCRNIAKAIEDDWKKRKKTGNPTVLADPGESTWISYFNGANTIARIYWENIDGMHKYAVAMCTMNQDTCKELCKNAGVDYIVVSPGRMPGIQYMLYGRQGLTKEGNYFYKSLHPYALDKVPTWLEKLDDQPVKSETIYRVGNIPDEVEKKK